MLFTFLLVQKSDTHVRKNLYLRRKILSRHSVSLPRCVPSITNTIDLDGVMVIATFFGNGHSEAQVLLELVVGQTCRDFRVIKQVPRENISYRNKLMQRPLSTIIEHNPQERLRLYTQYLWNKILQNVEQLFNARFILTPSFYHPSFLLSTTSYSCLPPLCSTQHAKEH